VSMIQVDNHVLGSVSWELTHMQCIDTCLLYTHPFYT
jgi:hypothetical protein